MKPLAHGMDDTVSTLYGKLRVMASNFAFKPGERINESALSRDLGASRTPLREALNRLVAEGFVELRAGRGFYCRELSPTRIEHLYQARMAIECEAVRQATLSAQAAELDGIYATLEHTSRDYATCADPVRLLAIDEAFHISLVRLSGNPELERMLGNVYDKIRFVRTADLRLLRAKGRISEKNHKTIVDLVSAGDALKASDAMRRHIEKRARYATEAVRHAFADLYAPEA